MNFKSFNKIYTGIIAIILLIILLTQSRSFYYLTETYLGRIFTIMCIILIAYSNQMLGLFAVLCVIISYNYYDSNYVHSYNYYNYVEGFENADIKLNSENNSNEQTLPNIDSSMNTQMKNNSQNTDSITSLKDQLKVLKSKENLLRNKLTALSEEKSISQPTVNNDVDSSGKKLGGKEGFCMPERELNILRGKQSNSIPLFNTQNVTETEPSDKSSFTSEFAFINDI